MYVTLGVKSEPSRPFHGAPRTYHRMATAVEDAGFEIRDQITWKYPAEFSKSRNISKDIDWLGGYEGLQIRQEIARSIEASGLSDVYLARLVGRSNNLVKAWRQGKRNITAADAEKLSRVLDSPVPKEIERKVIGEGVSGMGNSSRFRHKQSYDITAPESAEAQKWGLMPFKSEAFDLVVYDPPHIPNQGRDKKRDFNSRFGLDEFNEGYEDFMREAHRVLVDNGILLAKVSDYVHHHRYRWAHIDAIQSATNSGFTACDLIVKVRKAGALIDPRWETAHHSRRIHTYWIIFRKSPLCQKWWRPPKESLASP